MNDLRIAAAQFENRDNDKAHNLSRIDHLTQRAVEQGADVVCFHEASIPGYSWVQGLSKTELAAVAEPVPDGPSVRKLIDIAAEYDVIVMAGLFELDTSGGASGGGGTSGGISGGGSVLNCYVAVGPDGYITKFRKLHPFINGNLTAGKTYNVIDLLGWRIGFLICYDNNLVENPRITAMMGAQIIIAPHVTGCLPSNMPGRGTVDRGLWDNRDRDPVSLRQEFDGPKGRQWLLRWLPARAYENGVYYVFSNPIGWDYDTVKPGLAMVLDPFGEIIAESRALEDDVVVALVTPEKLENTSGSRYLSARRPELYSKLVAPQSSVTRPGWQMQR